MDIVGYPVRFAWNNLFDGATVTGNVEQSTLPWTNVLNPLFTRVGQASGLTTQVEVSFTIAGSTNPGGRVFIIRGHNLETGATIAILGATNAGFNPVATSLALTNVTDLILGEFSTLRTETYWRIQISGQAISPVQLGFVFWGDYTEFDFPDFATNMALVDPSVVVTAYGGGRSSFQKAHYRVIDFALSPLQQADKREFELIFATNGVAKPVFLFLDPWNVRDNENPTLGLDGLHRLTLLGYLNAGVTLSHLSRDWTDGPTITFEEARE